MASGDLIVKVADKETLDRTHANTNAILAAVEEDVRVKNIVRYGMKINKADSNPTTRCTYLFDAVGMTPAAMNFTSGVFDFGDWGDVFFVKNNYPAMVRYDGTEDYLNENLELEIKDDWQVFRFEYPVIKDGKSLLDENGKQVTKGRMLDFMGFQFHHDRTTIRKSNIESARRKANHIAKQDKISWYNASVMLSYMGLFKHTDTYNYYTEYIKPKINIKKLKRIVSKHSRKENEKRERMENCDRVTGGTSGGSRPDIVAVNSVSA